MNDFIKLNNNTYYEFRNWDRDAWVIMVTYSDTSWIFIKPLFFCETKIDIENIYGEDALDFLKNTELRKTTRNKYKKVEKIILDFSKTIVNLNSIIKK